jgi:hypothetical protein
MIEPSGFSEDLTCQRTMEIATRCSEEADIFSRQDEILAKVRLSTMLRGLTGFGESKKA